jgi:predicted RNase H-like HicB family nuclease
MRRFIAVVFGAPDIGYEIVFPDMPGCVASAATFDEAPEAAAEALAIHLREMERSGGAVPEPSAFTSVLAKPQYRNGVAIRVQASGTSVWRRPLYESQES